ncbi:Zinc finger homeobox protein 3 [Amphibalanus amphitrite]|uniref:Zinc finger homeobox protein 3 n=1 Tax=Amphibalanus amphitrite TaxID=1232801 RepID=A0A6A4WNP2_AMPAM|nr:Zinc finger homeobox protein 3 [Amphibalanus amphitrite]
MRHWISASHKRRHIQPRAASQPSNRLIAWFRRPSRRDIPPLNALPLMPPREGLARGRAGLRHDLSSSVAPPPNPSSTAAAAAAATGAAGAARSPFAVANKRFRTQMSPGQVSVLRSVFAAYRMPTMAECARLGAEIGLAKRVVQVWFQNSRAKEKKRQLQSGRPPTPPPQGCDLCHVTYGVKCSLQEHLLSRAHIERVQREAERARAAPAGAAASSSCAPAVPRSSAAAAASAVRPGSAQPVKETEAAAPAKTAD